MAATVSAICIVSHAAYGAMTGGRDGHAGGVERQTSMTARWLAARGHDVSLVVWNEGPPGDEQIDGVRVIKLCRQIGGLPGLRFLHPRWTSLWRALGRADADVYYHNCAEAITGQVAIWCRRHARPFVYSVAQRSRVRSGAADAGPRSRTALVSPWAAPCRSHPGANPRPAGVAVAWIRINRHRIANAVRRPVRSGLHPAHPFRRRSAARGMGGPLVVRETPGVADRDRRHGS